MLAAIKYPNQSGERSWRSHELFLVTAVFVASLSIIAISKKDGWSEPPYWDAAFSVFPAASMLATSDFDYTTLLTADTFLEGGPNVHANSSVTLLTAMVFKLIPNAGTAFLVLHWIQYTLAALTATLIYLWSMPLIGRAGALLAGLATLIFPLFLTQAGHMYLEIPSACVFLLALLAFQSERMLLASFWAFVAVSIKEPGIIVAGTLGVAAILRPVSWRSRVRSAIAVAAPSMLLALAFLSLHKAEPSFEKGTLSEFCSRLWANLKVVPDLLVLTLLSGLSALIYVVVRLVRAWRPLAGESSLVTRRDLSYLAFGMFPCFYLSLVGLGWVYLLPRYFVQIVPLMILVVTDTSVRLLGRRLTILGLALFCGVSIINANGRFYPFIGGNNGSDAERSMEYLDLLAAHRDAMAAAETLPSDVPIFLGLPEHYFSKYPVMGYVHSPLKNARCILLDSQYFDAELETFPDHFYLLYSFMALGGDKLNWLKTQAQANMEYTISKTIFQHGYYQAQLIEVRRTRLPSPRSSTEVR